MVTFLKDNILALTRSFSNHTDKSVENGVYSDVEMPIESHFPSVAACKESILQDELYKQL